MYLQRQLPSGILFYELHTFFCDDSVLGFVAGVAGLHEIVLGVYSEIRHWALAVENHLHFVGTAYRYSARNPHKILFGTDGNPVEVGGQGQGAVGFHRHALAYGVEFRRRFLQMNRRRPRLLQEILRQHRRQRLQLLLQ